MGSEVNCPSCGAPAVGSSGEPESCSECGQWWVPTSDAAAMRDGPHELEIQNAPGDAVRGPFDRLDLRERLYRGLLTGEELVRPVGGRFHTLQSIPDFAAILQLRERGKPRAMVTRRPVKEKRAPDSGAAGASSAALHETEAQPEQAREEMTAEGGVPVPASGFLAKPDKRRMAIVAVVTCLVGGLMLVMGLLGYSLSL